MGAFLRKCTSFLAAFLLSAAMFLAIPVLKYLATDSENRSEEKPKQLTLTMSIPPKTQKPPPEPKEASKEKPTTEAPKEMGRSKFSMDLGVGGGGGGGGAVIGGGAGGQASYEEGETDNPPTPIRIVAPSYPEAAAKAGVGGTVKMRIIVMPNGEVSPDIEFIQTPGNYGFEEVIRKAVAQWKFKPATVDGIPVAMRMEYPLEF
jgi:protein TonB